MNFPSGFPRWRSKTCLQNLKVKRSRPGTFDHGAVDAKSANVPAEGPDHVLILEVHLEKK
jgi:hypothetical protein